MANFSDRVQVLMDEVYDELRKEENQRKGKWDVLDGFSEAHQIAVVFGNFNYQVENGGIEQWIYNGYFHDDAEKLIEYLEAGAGSDDRCQVILDRVNLLDQYARDTDCNSDGNYSDEDGEFRSISDLMDCNKFDTWYYEHCDGDGWWEIVCGIIDKAEAREAAAAVSQDDPAPEDVPAIASAGEDMGKNSPLRVYIENAVNPGIGGFTIPLPTTKEALTPWLAAIEADADNPESIAVREIKSPMEELSKALGYGSYSLDELNYLAVKINGIGEYDMEVFRAAIQTAHYRRDFNTIVNLTENIKKFELQPAFSVEQYGEFLLQGAKEISADAFERLEQSADQEDKALAAHILKLESLVDPKAYGRSVVQEEQGSFTDYGYLALRGEFQEVYHGREDIPKEYRIFPHEDSLPAVANDEKSYLYSVGYKDWNGDFSNLIDREVTVVGKDEADAIQNAKRMARTDSRDFTAAKIDSVMGMDISVAHPEEKAASDGRESVLAKIREAKAAARNAPAQEKDHGERKKSYEPEV